MKILFLLAMAMALAALNQISAEEVVFDFRNTGRDAQFLLQVPEGWKIVKDELQLSKVGEMGTSSIAKFARTTPPAESEGAIIIHSLPEDMDKLQAMENILNSMQIEPLQMDTKEDSVFVFGKFIEHDGYVITRMAPWNDMLSQFILAASSTSEIQSVFDDFAKIVNNSGFADSIISK